MNGSNKSYTISGDLEDFTLFIDEISDTATFTSPYISYAQGELKDYDGIEKIEIYNNCTIEPFQDKVNRLETDKQDKLVSGTNIKTINNESILGSGNITIQGGGNTSTDISKESKAAIKAFFNEAIPSVTEDIRHITYIDESEMTQRKAK